MADAAKVTGGFRWPRNDEHTAIVGRNGTGKSQLGFHVLSKKNLKQDRWFILDYKGEDLAAQITRARDIEPDELPEQPGLYILHAHPRDNELIETWLESVWESENAGVFMDETYMVPNERGGALQGLLTQGRSKRTPVIALSQRPVLVPRFVFSEASHLIVFDLNDRRDRKTIGEVLPEDFFEWSTKDVPLDNRGKLPKYHSRWYNLKDDERFVLMPVPSADEIVQAIDSQLEPKRRWL